MIEFSMRLTFLRENTLKSIETKLYSTIENCLYDESPNVF